MKKLLFLIAILVSGLSFTLYTSCKTSSGASASKMLKFNLEKGQEYNYEMVWDMTQTMMGQENAFSIGAFYTIDVTENNAGVRTMIGTYKKFNMTVNMMGMQIDIDTDKVMNMGSKNSGEKNPIAMMKKVFSSIIGKSFTMKADEEGKILEVSGFKEMIGSMLDSLELDETEREQGMAALTDQFNQESVKDQFAQMFYIFPNKEVKVGDSWEKNYTAGGKMPGKYSTTYTVKEIEGDYVTLDSKAKIESEGEVGVSGTQTGNLIVDSKTGLVVDAKFDQEFSVTVQGVSMEITGKGRIKGMAKK